MKRYGLFLTTLGTTLVTALALHGAGWFSRPGHAALTQERGALSKVDPLSTAAGMQYRQCQARHWRNCMLQR